MEWQIGKNKVFLRGCVHEPLEDKRLGVINSMATRIQKVWKGQRRRKEFVRWRTAARKIQESYRAWRLRIRFIRQRRAAVVIQAHLRGMFAREVAAALREAKRVEEERRRKELLEEERRKKEEEAKAKAAAEAEDSAASTGNATDDDEMDKNNSFSGLADLDQRYTICEGVFLYFDLIIVPPHSTFLKPLFVALV